MRWLDMVTVARALLGLLGQADGTRDVRQQGGSGRCALQLSQHSVYNGRAGSVQPQAIVCEATAAPTSEPAVTG